MDTDTRLTVTHACGFSVMRWNTDCVAAAFEAELQSHTASKLKQLLAELGQTGTPL